VGSYLLVFLVAAGATALFLPFLTRLAERVGALDDTRTPPVPRIGGPALGLGSAAALILVGVVFAPTGSTLLARSTSLGPVLLGAVAILALGVADDIRPIKAAAKFAVQIAVAAVMYLLGVRIGLLSLPFGAVSLGPVVSPLVTILWLVGVTNAFNLLDGADGVAAGSAFFSATAIFIMSVALDHPAEVGVGLLPQALPVRGAGIPPARDDQHGGAHGGGKRRSPFFQAICSATSRGSCWSHCCTASVARRTLSQREVTHVSVPTRNRSGWRRNTLRHSGSSVPSGATSLRSASSTHSAG